MVDFLISANLDRELGSAALDGNFKLCSDLLAQGANPNARLSRGHTALTMAAASGRKDCLIMLLANGADPGVLSDAGASALLLATLAHLGDGGFSCVSPLVAAGSPLDHPGPNDRCPIHEAAWMHDSEVLELLLNAGANPNVRDENGTTPLMEAAGSGMVRNVHLLLARGAHLDDVDLQGRTVEDWAKADARLALAAERERIEIAQASKLTPLLLKERPKML